MKGRTAVDEMFRTEYNAFGELLDELSHEDWALRSLCPDWTVHDVVEHVAFHIHREGIRQTLGSTEKQTLLLVDRANAQTTSGLVEWFRSPPPAAALRSKVNVCELVIHQEDVRAVVGRPRTYPESTLEMCLDECTSVAGNINVVGRLRRLARGAELRATDLGWTKGKGEKISGRGQAVLLAIAGRPSMLQELTGDGVDLLRTRLPPEPPLP